MATTKPRHLLRLEYEKAAEQYLRSLPLEHFMEAIAQSKQREITVASLALVHARRPDVQHFSELLVQYPFGRRQRIRQVVPDNMIVVHDEPIRASTSYDVPLQPARPFMMLEYVSKYSERKDYDKSHAKYEKELKTPYYLTFHPEAQELILHKLRGKTYGLVKPNASGRYPIPKLELEVMILDGWVRFWFRGELLPLPADMLRALDEARSQIQQARAQAQQAQAQVQQAQEEVLSIRQQLESERREKEQLMARLRDLEKSPAR